MSKTARVEAPRLWIVPARAPLHKGLLAITDPPVVASE
jgi:hypothetical protein